MSREREVLESLARSLDVAALLKDGVTADELKRVLTKAASMFPAERPAEAKAGHADDELTLNVDGASRGNPGPAAAGVVIRAGGRLVEGFGQYLGRVTNNVAEYNALILGLERARELGAAKVRVFADSELMVRQLNGQYKVKNAGLQPLYGRARKLADGFASFAIRHVPRAQNAEADQMANRAIDEFDGVNGED
jgi:ribonuclease HI